jgi:hypothetical protein
MVLCVRLQFGHPGRPAFVPHGTLTLALQEALYGKSIILADREFVESGCEDMLQAAVTEDVALLVVGDPFGCVCRLRDKERERERERERGVWP